jgi:acyl-coenzyme A synthetase/AMP-(fatty) acid ligase
LLEKFKVRRKILRTISFLLYDHIGGVNTMLYTLSNGGCLITVERRDPDSVLAVVEKHRAELLPTSPTFLNLMLLSEAHKRYDLSSLRIISYGTEPMPEHTLKRLHELLPDVALQQTYGLSELGILQSKSREPDSLWVKVGGEGYETRVVDGILQIKARSSMLGYLNAPSPFTDDGWFNTNDAVEVDGDYVRILGRKSDIINVGGEKVYPAEVENVIQELEAVAEATVYGEKNAITGNIVCADITAASSLDATQQKELIALVKQHCREKLEKYKVPVRVNVVTEQQHTERFKKSRR